MLSVLGPLLTSHRLALRTLINDIQSAIANMRSTTFSSTEINIVLPASRSLWDAPSAREWKTLMLAQKNSPESTPLTLVDVIQDPWKLNTCGDRYDCAFTIYAALHCVWPQIASFLDSRALKTFSQRHSKLDSGPMWLEAQRQDSHQRLSNIRKLAKSVNVLTADINMMCELFSMLLYVSPIDAQKFVGRCGAEESQAIAPNLHGWLESDERRYATWHAGQILRAARKINKTYIQGFRAIAVYQACITLALPCLLSNSGALLARSDQVPEVSAVLGEQNTPSLQCSTDNAMDNEQVDVIILNGEEGIQSKSYLLRGHCNPALLIGNQIQQISSVGMMASTMKGIFSENHGSSNNALPPLAAKLVTLLTDLSKTT